MAKERQYLLLCPIARALDVIGDRWTLLILRDLHAGPARFSDLATGLVGIATNLLSNRLMELQQSALIQKERGPYAVELYALTPLGARTATVLFELAAFGSQLSPSAKPKEPGNFRAIAVTLAVACSRVVDPKLSLVAELRVAKEPFTVNALHGKVSVLAGSANEPEVIMATDYETFIDVTDGRMPAEHFAAKHVQLLKGTPAQAHSLLSLLGLAASVISGAKQS